MTTLTFQREELATPFWDEVYPLLRAHWAEVAHYQDIPLDPNIEAYYELQATNRIRVFTLRRGDRRELVGYALFFLSHNLHYRTTLQAQQDVVYVDPSERGTTGYRFIKDCDEALRAEGIKVVYHHVKAAHNFGPMLERIGYELVDLLYARRLD
jgi:hypothetical protein